MADFNYDTLHNDNVRFLQGTQAQLNKYLLNYTPGQGEDDIRGTAIEGAFYLTTDTHRLYVGRKITTAGTNQNKVIPVQVSSGITTVVNSGSLPAASVDAQKGDFYYIQDGNILAVLEEDTNGNKQWVQINAATEISGFSQTTSNADGHSDTVLINSSVSTTGGGMASAVGLVEGNGNVTLTPGSYTAGSGANAVTVPTIEISTKDTTYAIGTTAETTNGAPLGLKKDSGSTLDSSVTITGTNGIGVTSTAAGAISVKGVDFTNKGVSANAAAQGFLFALEYDASDGTGAQSILHSTKSTLDPTITYGATSGYSAPSPAISTFAQESAVHFANGNATLNVYTKPQTDQAITDAINSRLAAANAMTYMGTIKSSTSPAGVTATAVIDTIASGGTGHIGDTYKAACDFTYNGVDIHTGDLVILRSSTGEETNGSIATANLIIDVVPSGDEPFIGPSFSGDSNGAYSTTPGNTTQTTLNLVDKKNSSSLVAGLNIPNTEKIKITSTLSGTGNSIATLNIEHRTLTRSDNETANLTTTTGSDTIGNNTVSLLVFSDPSEIGTDNYGHVTGVAGKTITFSHNKISTMAVGYSDETLSSGSTLLSKSYASIALTDTLTNSISKSIAFESKTLSIAYNGAAQDANKALAIDIKWGSF